MDRGKGYSEEDAYFLTRTLMTGACDPHPCESGRGCAGAAGGSGDGLLRGKDQEALHMEWERDGKQQKSCLVRTEKNRKGELCICHQGSQPLYKKRGSMEEAGDNEMELELEIVEAAPGIWLRIWRRPWDGFDETMDEKCWPGMAEKI